ncbi:unnamed protein product [Effrenium voratum]|uniref:Uncharacterized protein n=1 Tax=Effrenium voratum TaxID=2562239 RepID=A0AA36NF01_9DINO|nr:unnamed protein product [Effrenium voratum]CAJ1431846.1 unnamed protein product [Effrenium voratum]CAJ1446533.1 unnamed protein product [Effrenium voratum]
MVSRVSVKQIYSVTNEFTEKSPWLPRTETVQGVAFVAINKWDTYFCKMVTGRSQDLRAGKTHHVNCAFLDELIAQRNSKSKAAVQDAMAVPAEGEENPKVPNKKRRVTPADRHLAPATITVMLPAVTHGGVSFAETSVRALWNVRNQQEIFLELDEEVLEHLRIGVLQSRDAGQEGRHHSAQTKAPAERPAGADAEELTK